ncbi:hypothetical protein C1645_746962 [Glomus cerebriforme]|uniref:Uncharacterized protein n=1 Tax=Glomus cerebriforme TaxID=658196 RepID=A0A397TWH0_9GLOM|nr:hypothetical protein C1645_746962 [Glomus cerebriforme]
MDVTPDYVYVSVPNSEKIINEIKKRIQESNEEANGQDVDVIEIALPPINSKHYLSILEDIHNTFDHVERIGENMFIKLDGGEKIEVHEELKNELKNQLPNTWWVQNGVTCVANNNGYLPDVGAWRRRPTRNQRRFPIIYSCPPPLIWIEVVYNRKKDREHAMNNIQRAKPHCAGTEFLIIALVPGKNSHPPNPNPNATSVSVGVSLRVRPQRGPYIGYWSSRSSYNAVRWYKISWNKYLDIGYNVRIDFNVILDLLTDDDEEDSDEDDEEDDDDDEEDDDDDEDYED